MAFTLAFFGAFNPPTRAHVCLSRHAMLTTRADGVLFVPSKMEYIRDFQKKSGVFSDAARLDMLRLIAAARPWLKVTDMEIKAAKQPYTYDTLCRLRESGLTPKLLIGSDNLPGLGKCWYRAESILAEFGVVCVRRAGDDDEAMISRLPRLNRLKARIFIVDAPEDWRHLSSTRARSLMSQTPPDTEALRAVVPEELDGLKRWL